MNTCTGEIVKGPLDNIAERFKISKAEALAFFRPIDDADLTGKQRREMKVSHHDTRTRLGIMLRKHVKVIGRNNPCPCGSGVKFKKCCLKEGPRI